MGSHPQLLLRRAQADPDNIGPGAVDPVDDRIVLLGRKGAERWGQGTDNLKAGMRGGQRRRQAVGKSGAASVVEFP